MTAAKTYPIKPSKLRVYSLRVDSLEASTKYEGKWIVNGSLGSEDLAVKLWMTTKQAGSIQRNLDADELFCVVDEIDPERIRFVWASNNREWLAGSFLKRKEEAAPEAAQAPEVKTYKKVYPDPTPNRFELGDEDLPF
jgi:hypothetical protein